MKPEKSHTPPGQLKPVNASRTLPDGTVEHRIFDTKTAWKARDKSEGWEADEDADDADDTETPEA